MSPKWQTHWFESDREQMTANLFWVLWCYIILDWAVSFGVESLQSVSLLSGQGHCLAASKETDPLTVDHCCGGQAAYNISSTHSLEMKKWSGRWEELCSRTQLWFMEQAFGKRFQSFGSVLWGNKLFFQTHFSCTECLVVCFRGVWENICSLW